MSCSESPVARKAYADAKALYSEVTFLGIIGDQSHQSRKSGHNCGAGREYSCTDPNYAHAVDIGVGANTRIGYDLVERFRKDPRVMYVIYRGRGYQSYWRGGATFASFDHDHHVHVSFGCGSTFNTAPFFNVKRQMTAADKRYITSLAEKEAVDAPFLSIDTPKGKHVNEIKLVQATLGIPQTGTYGVRTHRAVRSFQKFFGIKPNKYGRMNHKTWVQLHFVRFAKYFGF